MLTAYIKKLKIKKEVTMVFSLISVGIVLTILLTFGFKTLSNSVKYRREAHAEFIYPTADDFLDISIIQKFLIKVHQAGYKERQALINSQEKYWILVRRSRNSYLGSLFFFGCALIVIVLTILVFVRI